MSAVLRSVSEVRSGCGARRVEAVSVERCAEHTVVSMAVNNAGGPRVSSVRAGHVCRSRWSSGAGGFLPGVPTLYQAVKIDVAARGG